MVLDACVLYPTVMREVLLGVAAEGLFTPVWSARILGEWAHAARKLGPVGEAQAGSEIALLRARWPEAELAPAPDIEARLWLPDSDDVHVLATAIAGKADILLTLNAADFPRAILRGEGLDRRDPDGYLWQLCSDSPAQVAAAVGRVQARAEEISGHRWPLRALLKKARLPRLGKALAAT